MLKEWIRGLWARCDRLALVNGKKQPLLSLLTQAPDMLCWCMDRGMGWGWGGALFCDSGNRDKDT